jgi:hypothetical protein
VSDLDDFKHGKVEMRYPAIILDTFGEELALLMSCLKEGDLPVVVKRGDKSIQLDKKISDSAVNIHRLLTVYPLTLATAPDRYVEIADIESYMEVYPWTP